MPTMTETETLPHRWWTDNRGYVSCGRCGFPPATIQDEPCKGPCRVCGEDVLGDMCCPDFKTECVDCCGCHDEEPDEPEPEHEWQEDTRGRWGCVRCHAVLKTEDQLDSPCK